MNLSSNHTSTINYLYTSLMIIDQTSRYYCLGINLAFIVVLILSDEMRTKNLFYVNHATVVNIFYPAVLFAYIFGSTPNFADEKLNTVLCILSGYFREFANYIRSYSILIIAGYRYLAVFRVDLYRRVNQSNCLLLLPVVIVWLLSIIIPVTIDKSLQTYLTPTLCLNGNSDSLSISIAYFVLSYIFQTILPLGLVVYIYIKIMINLKRISRNLKKTRIVRANRITILTSRSSHILMNNRKENLFALHFFLMCSTVILTSIVFSVFYLNHIIPDYFDVLFYCLPILRVVVAIGISLIPITSLYFHPRRARLVRMIKSRLFQ